MFHETTKLYDIPLNHLDFAYITECNKVKELEKILKVLRSGSEGRYPELEKHCEEKLRSLDPENRLLRKPGSLLSPHQLPPEEREEIEYSLQEWLEETKKQQNLSSNIVGISDVNEDKEDPLVPNVRRWGSINPETGKGTRVQASKKKPTKLRTYDEWDKLGKEIEKELELEECEDQSSNVDGKHNEVKSISEKMKPNFSVLHARVRSMPNYIRMINAQREKEKGNEVGCHYTVTSDLWHHLGLQIRDMTLKYYKTLKYHPLASILALIAGDFTEALEYYERSLIYKPTTAVYNNRALLYLKQKKWRLAVDDSSRVLGEEPKNIKALIRRAQAFYELHSLEKARRDLEFVLEMEPNNSRALKLLKTVKEEHASRQRSHLKGGRRLVIDEVDEDSSDDDQDEGYDDAEDETNVKTDPVNPEDTQMPPPIKRGVEIEEIFDGGSTEENSVSPTNEKASKGESTSIQGESTVPITISDDNERKYSELIEELRRTDTSKLKEALDVKLDVKLLEEYIFALQEVVLSKGDYEFIHKSLDIISQSARFTIAAMMLSGPATKAIENIFYQLRSISTNPNGLGVLQCRFLSC